MRLFLASYRMGGHTTEFMQLLGAPPGPVAVIANAADVWEPAARASAVVSDITPLARLGFAPQEVDLREFIGDPTGLALRLAEFPLCWVRGGNTFVLRAQLARSGGDAVLRELLAADAMMYAGYSAGACVLSPSLRGLEHADDPADVRRTTGIEPIWSGLGLIDRPIVPHVDSPLDDPVAVAGVVDRLRAAGPVWALRDDHAIVIDGATTRLLS